MVAKEMGRREPRYVLKDDPTGLTDALDVKNEIVE